MHRRSVSSYPGPSRFRAEAETQYAKAGTYCAGTRASLTHASKVLSADQIVCQSKLYDAFELQGLEQQLDRKLNFLNDHKSKLYGEFELQELEQQLDRKLNFVKDHKSRSFNSLISDQESLNYKKSLISVSNLLIDRPSPPEHPLKHAGCTCNFCDTDASLSSLINDCTLLKCRKSIPASNAVLMQSDHRQGEAEYCSCNQPREPLHEEKTAAYAHRASSMPRFHYPDIEYVGDHSQATPVQTPANLEAAQEALQDQRAISSTAKQLKARKQIGAKGSKWSLVNSLFRSISAMHKKQGCMYIVQDEASTSTSTSLNLANQQQSNEYHHHHHHHHHHHVVNGIHFEEIDWPLSPTRLQELGWLMPKNSAKMEVFEQIDWPLSPAASKS